MSAYIRSYWRNPVNDEEFLDTIGPFLSKAEAEKYIRVQAATFAEGSKIEVRTSYDFTPKEWASDGADEDE